MQKLTQFFQVQNFGDILQLVIVELIYKVCLANPTERSRFIRCIYNLLNSSSPSVRYEAAGTLVRPLFMCLRLRVILYIGDLNYDLAWYYNGLLFW